MISQQLKDAIKASGISLNQLAKEAGVTQPVLSRFLTDDEDTHRDIRLEGTADKLAAHFGLELFKVNEPSASSPAQALRLIEAAAALATKRLSEEIRRERDRQAKRPGLERQPEQKPAKKK